MPLRSAVILVAILVVFAGPSWAQSVTGGVKVGANFSNIVFGEDDEDDDDLDHRTGLVIGGFASPSHSRRRRTASNSTGKSQYSELSTSNRCSLKFGSLL